MSSPVPLLSEFAARRSLARLHDELGRTGLAAAAAIPGLAAALDQHSAAVRDILTLGVEDPAAVGGAVLLAGYARGLLDQAGEQDWRPEAPADLLGWTSVDWLTARLVGVCALAGTMVPAIARRRQRG